MDGAFCVLARPASGSVSAGLDATRIAFAEIRSPNTMANLAQDARVEVNMVDVFSRGPEEWTVWLAVPATTVCFWIFWLMDRVGEYSENPFEGLSNDVPIRSMARGIEIDIRQMLDETDLPEPITAQGDMEIVL